MYFKALDVIKNNFPISEERDKELSNIYLTIGNIFNDEKFNEKNLLIII